MERWACWWEGGWYTSREPSGRKHQNLDKVWGLSTSSFTGSIFFFFFKEVIFFKEVKTLYQDVHQGMIYKVNH